MLYVLSNTMLEFCEKGNDVFSPMTRVLFQSFCLMSILQLVPNYGLFSDRPNFKWNLWAKMRDVFMMANMKAFELDLKINQNAFKEYDELLLSLQPMNFPM